MIYDDIWCLIMIYDSFMIKRWNQITTIFVFDFPLDMQFKFQYIRAILDYPELDLHAHLSCQFICQFINSSFIIPWISNVGGQAFRGLPAVDVLQPKPRTSLGNPTAGGSKIDLQNTTERAPHMIGYIMSDHHFFASNLSCLLDIYIDRYSVCIQILCLHMLCGYYIIQKLQLCPTWRVLKTPRPRCSMEATPLSHSRREPPRVDGKAASGTNKQRLQQTLITVEYGGLYYPIAALNFVEILSQRPRPRYSLTGNGLACDGRKKDQRAVRLGSNNWNI